MGTLLGLLVLVAIIASPLPATVHSAVGATPDWQNTTYSLTCAGLAKQPFQVTLNNGRGSGQSAGSDYDHFDVQYQSDAHGDLTAVGVASAVLLACSPQPSNFAVQEVQVFRSDDSVLGELPSPETLQHGAILPPVYVDGQLAFAAGNVSTGMLSYGPNDTHASGPSMPQGVTWSWNGSSFDQVG